MRSATAPRRRRFQRALGSTAALLATVLLGAAIVQTQMQPKQAAAESAAHNHNHYVYFDTSPGGKALSPAIEGASTDDMARLISWNYVEPATGVTPNSIFWWGQRHPSDGAYKRLHAEHSGKCLGANGHNVIQYACNDNADHFWAVVDETDGSGKLKNLASGLCIHLGWNNGDPAVLGTCDGDRAQLTITTSGTTLDTARTGASYRGQPHDARARAAGKRAADIAMREHNQEVNHGNMHSGAQLGIPEVPEIQIPPVIDTTNLDQYRDCNFYSGQMNGPATVKGVKVCSVMGKPDWGRGVWCADFARYAWREAGGIAHLEDLNPDAESFKEYGIKHGTWHPIGTGYTPQPGDAIVYKDKEGDGNSLADHVGIVYQYDDLGDTYVVSGNAGPGDVSYKKVAIGPDDNVQGFTSPVVD